MKLWWQTHLFLVLASYAFQSNAANFSHCFTEVTSCASSTGCTLNISNTTALSILSTSDGSPVTSVDAATAILYPGCAAYCGSGQQSFSWSVFSQEYSAWLLPYLALLSQLPFGARRRTDNLMSAILTLGSPTLAGYSLYMTLLNARWANSYLFQGIDYPSATVRRSVVRVLTSLQQVPLRVRPGRSARFESLVVHPGNDQWWTTLADELDYTQTWSIASATSISWVIIAYLLTVADSLSNVTQNIDSNGQGTGSVFLWLLPIVVGWLVLSPKCDYDRVNDAYHKANRAVFVADSGDPTADSALVVSNFGLTISPNPDWHSSDESIASPDELRIPPIFNYARVFSWSRNAYMTSLFYRAAWRKSSRRVGVDGNRICGNVRDDVPRENRIGTREQTIHYCRPDHRDYPRTGVLWPRGVFFNVVVASLMSLGLQWGTTGAAVLVVWYTPTIGFGCRSLAYFTYGTLSTLVWMLLVASSALGYYANHLVDDPCDVDLERVDKRMPSTSSKTSPVSPTTDGLELEEEARYAKPLRIIQAPGGMEAEEALSDAASLCTVKYPHTGWLRARTLAHLADWLRWTGKLVASVNAIGILVNSVFQFAGVYNNCYCDSSVFSWGSSAFNVINPVQSDIELAKSAWIGGLGLAIACCSFFVGCIYLTRDTLPS